ncbi:MAG: 16S rRNA (adenine(1518)-N(6)/adenine(1519)-N(6))-dimethyltransferase RsmA [Gemmatimonadota bacterium]
MTRRKKSLSQNFLVDGNLQRKIVEALEPGADDHVLEVGPGTGALTQHLAGRVGTLTLVELDDELASQLAEDYREYDDVEMIHADILDLPLDRLAGGGPLKVIGNIPYHITSPLIFHLLDRRPRPERIILTVQREVADRVLAKPGGKEYGALTIGVQAVATCKRLFNISRGAFRPRPDVDSTVICLTPLAPPPFSESEERLLRQLTRAAFSRRRKQLRTILRQAPEYSLSAERADAILTSLGIDPTTRPEALPVAGFLSLARALGPAE